MIQTTLTQVPARAWARGRLLLLAGCLLLFALGLSGPAGGADRGKTEAKQAVSLALEARAEMSQAIKAERGMRAKLVRNGSCLTRVTDSITPEIYTKAIRRDTFLIWQYSFFDALSVIHHETKPTAERLAAAFRRAARGKLAPANRVLREGLLGKAREITLGGRFPTSNPCAVARSWKRSGYSGARVMISQAVGWKTFQKTRHRYNSSDEKIIAASSLIVKLDSYDQGLRFIDQTHIRALQAWDLLSFPSAYVGTGEG